MIIFILIDTQSSQKAVFSFEKGSNYQNHSSSGSLHLVKNLPPPLVKSPILPYWGGGRTTPNPLLRFGKLSKFSGSYWSPSAELLFPLFSKTILLKYLLFISSKILPIFSNLPRMKLYVE